MPDDERTVIAQANMTMDGMSAGPGGDLSWLIEHAVHPQMSAYAPGRDILVLSSASIIQALLKADLLDELRLNLLPSIVGGGLRLLDDGLPPSAWKLVGAMTLETGGVGLHHRRLR